MKQSRQVLILKFIYSEKATKFCEIFPLLLTAVHTVKSKGKISQNFVAFLEYMNFNLGDQTKWSLQAAILNLLVLQIAYLDRIL